MRRVQAISAGGMGLAVVVAVVAAVLAGRGGCDVGQAVALDGIALAAGPISSAEQSGSATFYGKATAGGACGFPTAPANGYGAAVGPVEYAGAAACGAYIQVTGPLGSVTVKVTNLCPECSPGHLDLNNEAFAVIGDPVQGRIPITYRAITNATVPGPMSVYVKEGSSQWWLALLIDNHTNPLASVEVASGGSAWEPMRRVDYGYWLDESGAGPGPLDLRVTDVQGAVVVLPGVRVDPQVIQTPGAAPQAPAPPPPAAPARTTPAPTAPAAPAPTTAATSQPVTSAVVATTAAATTVTTAPSSTTSAPSTTATSSSRTATPDGSTNLATCEPADRAIGRWLP